MSGNFATYLCYDCEHVFETDDHVTLRCPTCKSVDVASSPAARSCPCGSGKLSWWAKDGNGIELERVCSTCEARKLAKYRPEILRPYTQADVDEPIEPED